MENSILCDGVGERALDPPGGFCFDPQVVRQRPVADDLIFGDSVGLGMRKYSSSAGSTSAKIFESRVLWLYPAWHMESITFCDPQTYL